MISQAAAFAAPGLRPVTAGSRRKRDAKRDDSDAFAELYVRYRAEVKAYLEVALGNAHDAQEVTQQVFLNVFEALPRYRAGDQPIEHWLFSIARNCAISHRRRNARTRLATWEEINSCRDNESRRDELRRLPWGSSNELHASIALLAQSQREVVVLYYLAQLTTGEIAGVLGRHEDDVRQLKSRALKNLRRQLAKAL